MPYIDQQSREHLDAIDKVCQQLALKQDVCAGDVNYLICRIADAFAGPAPDYSILNSLVGALECAKHEIQRRFIDAYEDTKITPPTEVFTNLRDLCALWMVKTIEG